MKKLLLIAIIAVAGVAAAVAQPRAVGVNLGGSIDVSYQHALGESNMIDLSVNIPVAAAKAYGWGIGATCTYDWINPFGTSIPWNEKGEWNWSLGVGAGAGIYGFTYPSWYVGAVGHVGVEYNFWFPLQLSVDWRPNVGIVDTYGPRGLYFNTYGLAGITLGVRYKF